MIENQHISEMSFLFYEEGNRIFSQYFGASDEQVMNKFIVDNWNTPYKFSGKELDDETGYSYFGARYYDPNISIWLSVVRWSNVTGQDFIKVKLKMPGLKKLF